MPAQQALAPLLVPQAMLPRATAFNSAGTEVAVIGGPALGGLVFVAGAVAVYGLCLALLLLASLRKHIQQSGQGVWQPRSEVRGRRAARRNALQTQGACGGAAAHPAVEPPS